MYVDLHRKQQRSNNIVITGLHNSDNDSAFVTKLLEEEFGCDTELWPGVSVARCQRLGKLQDNKLQPLLVTLDSRDQADYYIKNARYLRSSNNHEIKSNVYINADLTPSEAKAAYELRLERKRKRSVQGDQVASGNTMSTRVYRRSKSSRDVINQASRDMSDIASTQSINACNQPVSDYSQPISLKWRPTTAVGKSTNQSSSTVSANVCINSQPSAAQHQQSAATISPSSSQVPTGRPGNAN